jgi:hypothetical protein
MKRQRRRAGDVVRIDLGAGFHTYARVLPNPSFAFYDCRLVGEASLPEILASPILFRIAVMNHAVKTGRWPVIGHEPLNGAILCLPPKFIQDPIDKTPLQGNNAAAWKGHQFGSPSTLRTAFEPTMQGT